MSSIKSSECLQKTKDNEAVKGVAVTVGTNYVEKFGYEMLKQLLHRFVKELENGHEIRIIHSETNCLKLIGCCCGVEIMREKLKHRFNQSTPKHKEIFAEHRDLESDSRCDEKERTSVNKLDDVTWSKDTSWLHPDVLLPTRAVDSVKQQAAEDIFREQELETKLNKETKSREQFDVKIHGEYGISDVEERRNSITNTAAAHDDDNGKDENETARLEQDTDAEVTERGANEINYYGKNPTAESESMRMIGSFDGNTSVLSTESRAQKYDRANSPCESEERRRGNVVYRRQDSWETDNKEKSKKECNDKKDECKNLIENNESKKDTRPTTENTQAVNADVDEETKEEDSEIHSDISYKNQGGTWRESLKEIKEQQSMTDADKGKTTDPETINQSKVNTQKNSMDQGVAINQQKNATMANTKDLQQVDHSKQDLELSLKKYLHNEIADSSVTTNSADRLQEEREDELSSADDNYVSAEEEISEHDVQDQAQNQQSSLRVEMDENVYFFLQEHCQKKMQELTNRYGPITTSGKESNFAITLQLSVTKKQRKSIRQRINKIKNNVKIHKVEVQNCIDFGTLLTYVKANNAKPVLITAEMGSNLIKIVGSEEHEISQTKAWIEDLLKQNVTQKTAELKENYGNRGSTGAGNANKRNRNTPSTQNQTSSSAAGASTKPFNITSNNVHSLQFCSRKNKKLTVIVRHGDIVNQKTGAIVCPVYKGFNIDKGSLAKAIIKRAGANIAKELGDIKKSSGTAKTVVHTSSGRLQPNVKYLIHTIRPDPSQHSRDDPAIVNILYKMFLGCFRVANFQLKVSSINISPIGLRDYGVDLVTAAFCNAILEFNAIAEPQSAEISLESIHLIDNDPKVIKEIVAKLRSLVS